jgi:hypothetical protein
MTFPIAEVLLHPPLGSLTRLIIPGLFSGSGDLDRPAGIDHFPLNNVNAYGLTWSFFSVPDTIGYSLGQPVVYEERMLQTNTVHRARDGHDLVSEWHDWFVEGAWWLWFNPGPQRVHYDIRIGVQLVFYWIVLEFP